MKTFKKLLEEPIPQTIQKNFMNDFSKIINDLESLLLFLKQNNFNIDARLIKKISDEDLPGVLKKIKFILRKVRK